MSIVKFMTSKGGGEFIRHLYTTKIVRDMEASVKAISGGVAATGVIGPGIGIGIIFGNAIIGCARNPSVANKLLNLALMGAAFCESLGLMAIVVAFLTIL